MSVRKRYRVSVTEILRHSFVTELTDEEARELLSVDEDTAAEMIGDMTGWHTISDGQFEDPEIDEVSQ